LGDLDQCPTCGQNLKGTNLEKHIRELKKQISDLGDQIKKDEPVILEKQREALRKKIHQGTDHTRSFENKADDARASFNRLLPIVAQLQAAIRVTEQRITEHEQAENPYRAQLQQLRKQKTQLAADMTDIKERLQNLEGLIERYKFWVKGFKDVRLYIVDEVLQELELVTNTMLEEIGLIDWNVRYAIEKENKSGTINRGLNVVIQSPTNKDPVKFENWSGGEGQRLRLVSALALSEVLLNYAGVNPNLEALDEPSQHLSKEGVRDLCTYLSDRAKQLSKILLLVDHVTVESSLFTSVITVRKTKKGSYIDV